MLGTGHSEILLMCFLLSFFFYLGVILAASCIGLGISLLVWMSLCPNSLSEHKMKLRRRVLIPGLRVRLESKFESTPRA